MFRIENGQRGFALVLVLLLVAAATVLGVSYLLGTTTRVIGSQNLLHVARAKYVAESGLQHAVCILETNPDLLVGSETNPLGPFRLDESEDSYRFYAVADSNRPGKFYLTATGTAGGVTRTCSFTVLCNRGERVGVSHGMIIGGAGASLPTSLKIKGDVHINGNFLVNYARINGDVAACGTVSDPFSRIKGTVTTGAAKIRMLDIRTDYYNRYRLNGATCAAAKRTTSSFLSTDPLNGGGAIGANNVGGVVWLKPELNNAVKLQDNVEIRGTVVIDGDLVLEGKNITISSLDGFPAIVATGRIIIAPGATATLKGLVVTGGGIVPKDGQAAGSGTTILGGLVSGWIGYDSGLQGTHKLNYREDAGGIYDFSCGSADDSEQVTITILDYN